MCLSFLTCPVEMVGEGYREDEGGQRRMQDSAVTVFICLPPGMWLLAVAGMGSLRPALLAGRVLVWGKLEERGETRSIGLIGGAASLTPFSVHTLPNSRTSTPPWGQVPADIIGSESELTCGIPAVRQVLCWQKWNWENPTPSPCCCVPPALLPLSQASPWWGITRHPVWHHQPQAAPAPPLTNSSAG